MRSYAFYTVMICSHGDILYIYIFGLTTNVDSLLFNILVNWLTLDTMMLCTTKKFQSKQIYKLTYPVHG